MDDTVQAFRRFNRLYTRILGLLERRLLDSPLSLAEARLLFEVTASPGVSASALARDLTMDPGQVCRLVAKLMQQGLVVRHGAAGGRKALPLHPTAAGCELMADLEARSNRQARRLLKLLEEGERERLGRALQEVETLLGAARGGMAPDRAPVALREAGVGDLGWTVARHGEIYAAEHGFSKEFEKYVILGLAEYWNAPAGGSCVWVAEQAGRRVGSVGVVEREDGAAQLRWLMVEPTARRLGVGRKLVEQAVSFCREKGYRRLHLWTLAILHPARALYESFGFRLTEEKQGSMGGLSMVEERWELDLREAGAAPAALTGEGRVV